MQVVFVNPERCIGCLQCEIACAVEHSASRDLATSFLESPVPRKRVHVEAGPVPTTAFANAVTQAQIAASNLLGGNLTYDGAESMNSLKHLGIPIIAMGTTQDPDDVLHWGSESVLRSVYLRNGTIIGVQLAGDVRAAGVYRSLMLRRADVTSFGRSLVEPAFDFGSVYWDALILTSA